MKKSANSLPISEAFYSIQGEGRHSGKPAVFVRLSKCNLMCGGYGTEKDKQLHDGATWRCDTIETWMTGKWVEFKDVIPDKFSDLLSRKEMHLVLTGGEPMLHQDDLLAYIKWLEFQRSCHPFIEVETNGTVAPGLSLAMRVHQWNVSPKLENSGMKKERCVKEGVINTFIELGKNPASTVDFKFVIAEEHDMRKIRAWYPMIPLKMIILMPACETREQLQTTLPLVAELAKEYQMRMCSRLQIEAWDKTTGV